MVMNSTDTFFAVLDDNENSNMYVSNPEEERRVKAIKASFISTGFRAAKRR
jgi:hypothetical protein